MDYYGNLNLQSTDIFNNGIRKENILKVSNDSELLNIINPINGYIAVTLHDHKLNIYKSNHWEKFQYVESKQRTVYNNSSLSLLIDFQYDFYICNNTLTQIINIPSCLTQGTKLNIFKFNSQILKIEFNTFVKVNGQNCSYIENIIGNQCNIELTCISPNRWIAKCDTSWIFNSTLPYYPGLSFVENHNIKSDHTIVGISDINRLLSTGILSSLVWKNLEFITTGHDYCAGIDINNDILVSSTFTNFDPDLWNNIEITQVGISSNIIAALTLNGHILVQGQYISDLVSQISASTDTFIKIAVFEYGILGLTENKLVKAFTSNSTVKSEVEELSNIVDIDACGYQYLMKQLNNTTIGFEFDVSSWTNINKISCGRTMCAAITNSNTIKYSGAFTEAQKVIMNSITNAIDITCGDTDVTVLHSDRSFTIISTGSYSINDIFAWSF